MKGRSDYSGCMSEGSATTTSSTSKDEEIEWEMRPGGMLVQKRTEKSDSLAPNLLIRVAYGALRYEISVNSQATFGMIDRSVCLFYVLFFLFDCRENGGEETKMLNGTVLFNSWKQRILTTRLHERRCMFSFFLVSFCFIGSFFLPSRSTFYFSVIFFSLVFSASKQGNTIFMP